MIAHAFTNSASAFADEAQRQQWQQEAIVRESKIIEGGLAAIQRIPVHPRFARRLPDDLYHALTTDANRLSPAGVARTMRYTTPAVSVRDIAATNPRPALLCFGRNERRFAPLMQWATQEMAQLRVVELNAGHAVNMEDAAGFNQAMRSFIEQYRS